MAGGWSPGGKNQRREGPPSSVEDFAAGRVMPHNREAEEGILGAILINNQTTSTVIESLGGPEDFYVEANEKIYRAMIGLTEASQPIDMITLVETLSVSGELPNVGGAEYVAHLMDATPTTANVNHHARIVREKAAVRRAVYAAKEIAAGGMGDHGDVEEFLDEAERKIFEVARSRQASPYTQLKPIVHEVFNSIEAASQHEGSVTGVPSTYTKLDELTAGFQPGDLIIIAGRPSMGKTAFALNVGINAAMRDARRVLVFSLEMGKESLVRRMLCSEGRVDASRVRTGTLTDDEWPRLIEAAGTLTDLPVFVDDSPALSVLEVRAKARRMKAEQGLDLIIVDYLQLMRAGGKGAESREKEISEISRSLKALAKELPAPVIALSQLNRALEGRQDKRPMLADLRESGAIEQDADLILFIYRDEVYNKDTEAAGIAEIIIGKQRNGPTGTVELRFTHEHTRFDNLSMRSGDDYV